MNAYLLTWNPSNWKWDEPDDSPATHVATIARQGTSQVRWSTGNRKSIIPGDRMFLFRQGPSFRGVLGAGRAVSAVFSEAHWNDERAAQGDRALYVDVALDSLVLPENVLPMSALQSESLRQVNWATQASGISIPERAWDELERLWAEHIGKRIRHPFRLGQSYTRKDIYMILGVPNEQQGGDWDTGYHRHRDDWFIFANVGSAGRTGHDYENHWAGDDLAWRGRTGSRIDQPRTQSLLKPPGAVYIFTREADRLPFVYRGSATAKEFKATVPVTIVWQFNDEREVPSSRLPDEVSPDGLPEGAKKQVWVNVYERNPAARAACIKRWGWGCSICKMTFVDVYGSLGTEFIHVHHLKLLSSLGEEYVVDPIKDLRPVCPNCHAMLHRQTPPLSIEELQDVLKSVGTARK